MKEKVGNAPSDQVINIDNSAELKELKDRVARLLYIAELQQGVINNLLLDIKKSF